MRILKIESLPKANEAWIDRDTIMFHACFQILKDAIEKENVDTHVNYEANKDFVDEVRFLYTWYENRRLEIHNEKDNEDDEMLLRLIKIRTGLWT